MDNLKINTKPELELEHKLNPGDLPPGSYIIKDGKILPNLEDEAMLSRSKKNVTPPTDEKEIKKTELNNGPIH
jgi:hypothetical protein